MVHSSGSGRAGTCPTLGRARREQGPPSLGAISPSSPAVRRSEQPLGMAVPELGHGREQGTMPLHARGRSDAKAVPAGTMVRDTPAPCLLGVRNFLAASDGGCAAATHLSVPRFPPSSVNASPPPPPPPSRHDLMLFMFFGNCVSAEKPRRAPSSAAQLYCGELRHIRSESITPRSYNTGSCGYPLIYI